MLLPGARVLREAGLLREGCCAPQCCQPACCEPTCYKVKRCRPTPVRTCSATWSNCFECKGCYCEPAMLRPDNGLLPGTGLLCKAGLLHEGLRLL